MGKNDNLIEDYRNIITNMLLSNSLIVDILGEGKVDLEEADVLIDGKTPHIQPYEFLPGTLTETGSYIMYDMDENSIIPNNSVKSVYSEVSLYFWVVTHRNMMKYKGRLRNDILTRELKILFGEKDGMGIAKNHFIYNKICDVNNNNYAEIGRAHV